MGRFTAVLEVDEGAGWKPSAPIELKADDEESAYEAGLDFICERNPRGDRWRLRVWRGERIDLLAAPEATVGPKDRAAAQRRCPGTVLRAGRRRHVTRMSGPASEVVQRVRADELVLGSAVLVTGDRANTAAVEGEGPLWPAAHADRAVRATVRQMCVNATGPRAGTVDVVTSAGEVRGVREDRTFALA